MSLTRRLVVRVVDDDEEGPTSLLFALNNLSSALDQMAHVQALRRVHEMLRERLELLGHLNAAASDWSGEDVPNMDDLLLHRAIQLSMATAQPQGPPPVTSEDLGRLRTCVLTPSLIKSCAQQNCVVCLEAFTVGAEVTELLCKHIFCPSCIKSWLEIHRTCPVCRTEVVNIPKPKEDVEDFARKQQDGLRVSRLRQEVQVQRHTAPHHVPSPPPSTRTVTQTYPSRILPQPITHSDENSHSDSDSSNDSNSVDSDEDVTVHSIVSHRHQDNAHRAVPVTRMLSASRVSHVTSGTATPTRSTSTLQNQASPVTHTSATVARRVISNGLHRITVSSRHHPAIVSSTTTQGNAAHSNMYRPPVPSQAARMTVRQLSLSRRQTDR